MNGKWLLILGVLALAACQSKDAAKPETADQTSDKSAQVAEADAAKTAVDESAVDEIAAEVDAADVAATDPDAMLTALNEKYDSAMSEFRTVYGAASAEERRQIVADKYPKPDDYAVEFMQLATDNPDHPAAVQALLWVAQRVRGDQADEAIDILFENHSDSPEMSQLCFSLMYGPPSGKSQQRLEKLMKESPHHDVQGLATYCLASFLQRSSKGDDDDVPNDDLTNEYIGLFKKVIDDYSDVKFRDREIAKMASGAIFEIENLAIGKVAPDIEAEDLDGVSFKLSDYRGKVVMLDFWGDW